MLAGLLLDGQPSSRLIPPFSAVDISAAADGWVAAAATLAASAVVPSAAVERATAAITTFLASNRRAIAASITVHIDANIAATTAPSIASVAAPTTTVFRAGCMPCQPAGDRSRGDRREAMGHD